MAGTNPIGVPLRWTSASTRSDGANSNNRGASGCLMNATGWPMNGTVSPTIASRRQMSASGVRTSVKA